MFVEVRNLVIDFLSFVVITSGFSCLGNINQAKDNNHKCYKHCVSDWPKFDSRLKTSGVLVARPITLAAVDVIVGGLIRHVVVFVFFLFFIFGFCLFFEVQS